MMPLVMLCGPKRSGKDTAAEILAEELNGQMISLADPLKRFLLHHYHLTKAQLWGADKEQEIVISKPPRTYDLERVKHGEALLKSFFDVFTEGWFDDYDLNQRRMLTAALVDWEHQLPERTTPRRMLQTLGTECVRSLEPNLWIDFGLAVAEELLVGGCRYERARGLVEDENQFTNVVVIPDGRFRNEVLGVLGAGGECFQVCRPPSERQGAGDTHRSETEIDQVPNWWFKERLFNDGTLSNFQFRVHRLAREMRVSGRWP